jgi:hypothetical protein
MNKEKEEIYRDLLEEIKDWMMDNGYECGGCHGCIIYERIIAVLNE